MITKAIIPAAGLGTRLKPLTDACPKELLPIGRYPVLWHVLLELQGAGISEVLFVVSHRKPQISACFGGEFVGEACLPAIKCEYVIQQEQRGLGDAILCAEEWARSDPFLVAFGDCLIEAPNSSAPIKRLIKLFDEKQAEIAVLVETVSLERVSKYGIISPKSIVLEGKSIQVKDIVEKPAPNEAPSQIAVSARYLFAPSIFEILKTVTPDSRGEINVTDAVKRVCMAGGEVWALPLLSGEARCDIGGFETFAQAFIRAALMDEEFGEKLREEFDLI